jgi:hypothetical protein
VNKIKEIEKLNEELKPIPEDLPGRFFPEGYKECFDLIFLALRPSMNMPREWDGVSNYNFDAGTPPDNFFKKMLIDYRVAGNYVTDIVKKRASANQKPTHEEIIEYLPFLIKEIEIIKPKAIILIGKKVERIFWRYIQRCILGEIKVDWVWHYSQQGAKTNKKIAKRFKEVINNFSN